MKKWIGECFLCKVKGILKSEESPGIENCKKCEGYLSISFITMEEDKQKLILNLD